jgi:hypothetical protein
MRRKEKRGGKFFERWREGSATKKYRYKKKIILVGTRRKERW